MALILAFLAADNENRQLEDSPLADFGRSPERLLLAVRTKSINESFVFIEITTIVVFVIMIQRIFPPYELAPTHSTIVIWRLSIHLF